MPSIIPVFIIEEHNEAFYIWKYCIKNNIIKQKGNVLFHVDEHSDMGVPRYDLSVKELNDDLDKILDFTRTQVGISNFINLALYLEIFNRVYWIRQAHPYNTEGSKRFIASYRNDGMKLIGGKSNSAVEKGARENPDIKLFDFFSRTVGTIPKNRTGVLDIDLDYFSCSGNPNELERILIQITQEEYKRLKENIYHKIYYQSVRMKAEEIEGNYFLVLNDYKHKYEDSINGKLKVSIEMIQSRIDCFANMLRKKNFKPTCITICRSRFSGYTPGEQWEIIEQRLLQALSSIFTCEIQNTELQKYSTNPALEYEI